MCNKSYRTIEQGVFTIAKSRPGGLGKGLDALFADNESNHGSVTLPITEIEPNKDQPRKHFDQAALAELADSIREHGILQPLLVRPLPSGRYQLIAGERRWRASRMAGLTELPVVIREMSDEEAMELALIENLQREDLNPIEEAFGYRQLMDHYGMTQEKVAVTVGKSRPAIANALRLLALPNDIVDLVRQGEISAGHAKALLSLEDDQLIRENALKVQSGRITVREIEQIAKKLRHPPKQKAPANPLPLPDDHQFAQLELAMGEELGRRVFIKRQGTDGEHGQLQLEWFDKTDLCDLIEKLTGQPCTL